MSTILVSPLSLNQLTRDYWGSYDAVAIERLAKLAKDPCYRIKFYKAPVDDPDAPGAAVQNVLLAYRTYGMKIKPGSLIFGVYLPFATYSPFPSNFPWTVQITDVSLGHRWWDDPISGVMIGNQKPTYMSESTLNMGGFPNLLCAPYPVVGSGEFDIEFQNLATGDFRTPLVFGVLEDTNVG